MVQVPPATPPAAEPSAPVCYRHPKRETYVQCTRCERYICPECMHEASVGHQCPECVALGRRTVRAGRTPFGATLAGVAGYVTKTLIAINVAVAILSTASAGGRGMVGGGLGGLLGGPTRWTELGADVGAKLYQNTVTGETVVGPGGVYDGEYYRFFTAMFLHYGLLHLLVNMWALWVLGRNLETVLGPVRFLTLYLVSGLGGSVSVYIFAPYVYAAGASGAIFGLFGALFVVLKKLDRDASQLIPLLIINLAISLWGPISLSAHVGGLVTGVVVSLAMAYAPRQRRNAVTAAVIAAVLVVFAIATVVQTVHLQSLRAF